MRKRSPVLLLRKCMSDESMIEPVDFMWKALGRSCLEVVWARIQQIISCVGYLQLLCCCCFNAQREQRSQTVGVDKPVIQSDASVGPQLPIGRAPLTHWQYGL